MKATDYQVISMWRQGISEAQISHMFDCTIEDIRAILKSNGICVECSAR